MEPWFAIISYTPSQAKGRLELEGTWLLNSAFSNPLLGAWNRPWWKYLHQENCEWLQSRTSVLFQCQFACTRMPDIHNYPYSIPRLHIYSFIQPIFIERLLCASIRNSGSRKPSPHFIYRKTEVQRNELTCPETLSGSPLPGSGDVGWEWQTRCLPSCTLHSFQLLNLHAL